MNAKATLTMPRTELRGAAGDDGDAADLGSSARRTGAIETMPAITNAFTIDVEDYYHVSALASAIPRDTWNQRESRVSASTERLLAMLEDRRIKGTFFVLGWVADKVPQLVKRIASL